MAMVDLVDLETWFLSPETEFLSQMNRLALTLLGTATVAIDGRAPLHFRTDKIRALLVYLALEGERPHQRHSLAALFWPEMPEQTAMKNLRQSLHRLQQTLDEQSPGLSQTLLTITRQTVQYDPALLDVDVVQFQTLLADCERHPHRHLHLCQGRTTGWLQPAGFHGF
jgi:DNA-binding SARP family transcriptional activator